MSSDSVCYEVLQSNNSSSGFCFSDYDDAVDFCLDQGYYMIVAKPHFYSHSHFREFVRGVDFDCDCDPVYLACVKEDFYA